MFASHFFTYFTAALTGVSLVSTVVAEPVVIPGSGPVEAVAMKKRDDVESQVVGVLNTLKSAIAPAISTINSLKESKQTITNDNIGAPLQTIKDSLDEATTSLGKIEPAALVKFAIKRQSNDEVANLIAGLLTSVTNALEGLLDNLATAPIIGVLFPGIDASLAGLLHAVETLLAGVLILVANLLVNVAALLRSLAFGLTLAALGL